MKANAMPTQKIPAFLYDRLRATAFVIAQTRFLLNLGPT
jgi:hypothetical protein